MHFSCLALCFFFFFFNDTATTEIYTLSLHDALPISPSWNSAAATRTRSRATASPTRSEEHTSELQSPLNLVCRLLLEKKKTKEEAGARRQCAKRVMSRETVCGER